MGKIVISEKNIWVKKGETNTNTKVGTYKLKQTNKQTNNIKGKTLNEKLGNKRKSFLLCFSTKKKQVHKNRCRRAIQFLDG
jgi:hypothetical protein